MGFGLTCTKSSSPPLGPRVLSSGMGDSGTLVDVTTASETTWLTVPDLVEILGTSPSRVRRLIEDRALLGSRVDGVLKVPASFIRDGEPLSELRGTLVLLGDNHFTDEEAMRWLLNVDENLAVSPIDALLAGRKAEVRRVAQALAF